ncbi:hypothetical protein D3C84_690380 [compost metagenome]
MEPPESMQTELSKWNNGSGIDLESWVGCSGNFSLAVGYITVFWPEFVELEGYIVRAGTLESSIRSFEAREQIQRKTVELVINHLHIADIQYYGCDDISKDKLVILGNTLKEIYESKLKWQFPSKPCTVEFYIPDDDQDFQEYQISFWQNSNEVAHV